MTTYFRTISAEGDLKSIYAPHWTLPELDNPSLSLRLDIS